MYDSIPPHVPAPGHVIHVLPNAVAPGTVVRTGRRQLAIGPENDWPSKDSDEIQTLFEKVLTKTDVSKAGRLVVPTVHAEVFFPAIPAEASVTLTFLQPDGQEWSFTYRSCAC